MRWTSLSILTLQVSANHNEEKKQMFMPEHRKLVSCSYVNGMKCWNNFEKDEFQPKSNHDMMQCVTCKKSYLFAPKLKTLEKKETIDVIVEQKIYI